ncbi:conserved hypothetical protein [Nitrosococcus halophilus Nc 4]|uniref:DUF2383 domain-containing protein n=2 Tax=Nitrosococcus halophilus TaxID=133539 RepID=D5C1V2_NITHN|nr:conserved hypothetical protein [Nitrosococcus halophilus Nc 4]
MWLDDREVALDEVILKCKDIARDYKKVLSLTDDLLLVHLFEELAEQRKNWVARLESHIRKLGGLPSDIDPEKQILEEIITHTKVALSDDERNILLNDRQKEEEELKTLVQLALRQEIPEETRLLLRQIEEEIEITQRRLLEVRSRD